MQHAPLTDVSLAARGRWHTLSLFIIATWMVLGAGIVIAKQLGAPVVWWDLIHPFTIGALTTAIIVYSTHFAETLTRTATQNYRHVAGRVALVQVGLVLLLVDRAGVDWGRLSDVGAGLVILSLVLHIWVIIRALRGSLAGSFAVTVPFYIAAAAFMIVAIVLAILAGNGVGNYSYLIAAHQRGAVWGFAWLTIVATVVTIVPTLTGTKIAATARARCTRALIVHSAGLATSMLALALGFSQVAGIALLLVALAAALVLIPVIGGVLAGTPVWSGAAAAVVCGLGWLAAIIVADALSLALSAPPRAITFALLPAFVGAGLLQMITGVLSHVIPTLRGGGPDRVQRGRAIAGYAWPARLVLINLGGVILLAGAVLSGIIMMGLGIGLTLAATLTSVLVSCAAGLVPRNLPRNKGETHG